MKAPTITLSLLVQRLLLAGGLILGCAAAAFAHHSNAAYDLEHMRTLEGTVKTVNWSNPHINFHVETDAKEGEQPAEWVLEVSSPGVLSRSGWTKRSLQPGDHASFYFAPLRDGSTGGFLIRVTLKDGTVLSYSLSPAEEQ
jgi:Family of unknown function (DUF6152)